VQTRAGVRDMASKIGTGIRSEIAPGALEFLRSQRFAVVASVAAAGDVWASSLSGPPGFLSAIDPHTLAIDASPAADDPLADALRVGARLGMVVMDFAARRRMRVNGHVVRTGRPLLVGTDQVYVNCPKYIQRREPARDSSSVALAAPSRQGTGLGAAELAWIEAADTFFVASAHPSAGADASHRGGSPGFVRVRDERTLRWPDYAGNTMFQTLGNLAVSPSAGLLFIDFERGDTLQLSGRARVVWDAGQLNGYAGAERLVEFSVDRWIARAGAAPRGYRLIEPSPFNPPARGE